MVTSSTHPIAYPKTRRVRFRFGQPEPMRRHYLNDDIAFSHLIAILSAIFPPGEEFFIRSVRRYASQITEPGLKKRVAGFIGQEMTHGLQHRELNDQLADMGYAVVRNAEAAGRYGAAVEEYLDSKYPDTRQLRLPRLAALSITATGEHFTAVLAERLLTKPQIQALMTDPEVRNLLNWHAFEELEHKSVAFDVYRTVGGPEWLRIATMRVTATLTVPAFILAVWASIAITDPEGRRQPLRVLKETAAMARGPFFKDLYGARKPYLRQGFHPDEIDTNETLEHWRQALFGDEGQLAGHLKQA